MKTLETAVRLVIAEDFLIMRERLQDFLASEHDVLGAFGDCESLIKALGQLRPEVIVLDISMPLMGGISAAEQIRGSWPEIKIVFVTQHSERAYQDKAFSLGACAYVLKRDLVSDLLPAIREASAGRTFLSPRLAIQ